MSEVGSDTPGMEPRRSVDDLVKAMGIDGRSKSKVSERAKSLDHNVVDLVGSPAERSPNVFHEQDEMKLVCRASLEFGDEMEVEVAGLLGLGVDEQAPAADLVGQLDQAGEDVSEQPSAQPSKFVVHIHSDTGQENDRREIAPCSLAQPIGSVSRVDLGHAPGVEGEDPVIPVLGDHVDPCGPTGCRPASFGWRVATGEPLSSCRARRASAGRLGGIVPGRRRDVQGRRGPCGRDRHVPFLLRVADPPAGAVLAGLELVSPRPWPGDDSGGGTSTL